MNCYVIQLPNSMSQPGPEINNQRVCYNINEPVSHDFCVKDVKYKENNYVFLYVFSYPLLNIFLSLELNIHIVDSSSFMF
jgi:hypothetical protein